MPSHFHPDRADLSRRESVVLVHGFNNTDSEAAAAYFGFRVRLAEIFQRPDPSAFEPALGDSFWPGDADWWSLFDKVDFLIYPVSVHSAIDSAAQLADLLWQMPNLHTVDFIGHSLGCRVTMEALLLLRTRPYPMIRRVVLMAAAVPSEMFEPGGKFYDMLTQLAFEGTDIRILHSKQDPILHYCFPAGQAVAGAHEASSRALGRFGPTPAMPGFPGTLTEREISGAGHSDYWGHTKSPPSRVASDDAGHFLHLGDLWRDVGTARNTGVYADLSQPRDLGTSRTI